MSGTIKSENRSHPVTQAYADGWDAIWGARCPSVSPDGRACVLPEGHTGMHQATPGRTAGCIAWKEYQGFYESKREDKSDV